MYCVISEFSKLYVRFIFWAAAFWFFLASCITSPLFSWKMSGVDVACLCENSRLLVRWLSQTRLSLAGGSAVSLAERWPMRSTPPKSRMSMASGRMTLDRARRPSTLRCVLQTTPVVNRGTVGRRGPRRLVRCLATGWMVLARAPSSQPGFSACYIVAASQAVGARR